MIANSGRHLLPERRPLGITVSHKSLKAPGANAQFRRDTQAIENDAIAGTDSFAIWCRGAIKAGHEMLDQDYLASCDHNVANSIVATGAHLSRTTQGSSVRIFSRAFRKFNASRGVQSPS